MQFSMLPTTDFLENVRKPVRNACPGTLVNSYTCQFVHMSGHKFVMHVRNAHVVASRPSSLHIGVRHGAEAIQQCASTWASATDKSFKCGGSPGHPPRGSCVVSASETNFVSEFKCRYLTKANQPLTPLIVIERWGLRSPAHSVQYLERAWFVAFSAFPGLSTNHLM